MKIILKVVANCVVIGIIQIINLSNYQILEKGGETVSHMAQFFLRVKLWNNIQNNLKQPGITIETLNFSKGGQGAE